MRNTFIIISFIILGNNHLFAQTECTIKRGKLTPNSFLEITGLGTLVDTRTNSVIFNTVARYGEAMWYKINDTTFLIEFYSNLPEMNKCTWQKHLAAKCTLIAARDYYSLTRDKSNISYPILSNADFKFIKKQLRHPTKGYHFEKYSDWEKRDPALYEFDSYLTTLGLTAVAIMNGKRDLIKDFNNLQKFKDYNGGVCYETYEDLQFILSLYEFEIFTGKEGKKYLREKK